MCLHAAVGETVGLAPKRTRGFVNAVLRKVSRLSTADLQWPSDGARLSYPDWIVDRFRAELGDDAVPALERMNQAPPVTTRDDGYVQDESSQWVAAAVEARPDERILDLCAAPGGKATAMAGGGMAGSGATVIANDQRFGRARMVQDNVRALDLRLPVVTGDGTAPPFRRASLDAVLLDAPCSGLGALRRRADARRRIRAEDIVELAALQASCSPQRRHSWRREVDSSTAVHDHRSRVRRPRDAGGVRGRLDTPGGRRLAGVPTGVASAAARCRHRWHGPDSVPSTAVTNDAAARTATSKGPHRERRVVHGTREDLSGQALVDYLTDNGFDVVDHRVTADGADLVAAALVEMCEGFAGVVVSTGGTGFAPRDQTPEGTAMVIEREAPGVAEAMRLCNPLGRLSRGSPGSVGTPSF